MTELKIVFNENSKEDILKIFGKATDEEGYLVESDNTKQRVLTKKGEEINIKEWAGVVNGSESFIKSNAFSLIDLAKKIR
jgi:hypothetical protein